MDTIRLQVAADRSVRVAVGRSREDDARDVLPGRIRAHDLERVAGPGEFLGGRIAVSVSGPAPARGRPCAPGL